MSHLEVSGKKIELNEEGFLTDSKQWDKQVAEALAKAAEGIDNLTPEHWAIIEFIRNHYMETNLAPMVRSICKTTASASHLRTIPLRSCQGCLQNCRSAQAGRLRVGFAKYLCLPY
jgi:TusE/DsrC/DsvC family sulfur relay protein